MSKREKIILAVMCVGLVVAGYIYFQPQAGQNTDPEAVQVDMNRIQQIVNNAKAIVNQGGLSELEEYKMNLAAEEWAANPFFEEKTVSSGGGIDEEEEAVVFTYGGYVVIDGRRLAVINDLEYEAGEELEVPGYYLADVTPRQVLIIRRNQESLITDRIEVPLEEDSFNLLIE